MLKPFDDTYFMRKALEQAQIAYEQDEIPVGAVIVSENQIIARAHNNTELLNDVTAHAEMQAITSAADYLGGKYLKGCTLYVTLEPCQMCAGGLYWSQISEIVWAADDPKRGFRSVGGILHPTTKYRHGVLQDEAAKLIQACFRDKRKL